MTLQERITKAAAFLKEKIGGRTPDAGLILGSGQGDYADGLEKKTIIPYGDIPGFLQTTVEGHKGQFVLGQKAGKTVLCMQGRFHFYEGHTMGETTLPVRVMQALGIETLILTNAAGGIRESFSTGDLMVIADHINFSGQNPLIGQNLDEFGQRFPDMTEVYDKALGETLIARGKEAGINLEQGVYVCFTGPSYETPAEIRFARMMGADAVGMSTVPEAIVARHGEMKVLGISCITNLAAGMQQDQTHEDVVETANRVKATFRQVLDLALEIV